MKSNQIASANVASCISALACVAAWMPVAAQTVEGDTGAAQLEEVVVTGSRLQVAGFQAPTPVTVVGAQTIEQRAPANVVDILVEQPAFRITNTDSTRAGGVNPQNTQATLDLRSMTAFRTLTLINGHRSVGTSWDNTVDSQIIPVGLVERIDVVTGGASAAYGSDAVAGVVNIMLRNNLQGVRATAQMGLTEYSAAKQYTFNLAGGTALMNGRLHVIGGIDYNKTDPITDVYGKQWARDEIGGFAATTTYRVANNLPQTFTTTGVEPANTAPGSLYVAANGTAYTFDASGNPVLFPRGAVSNNGTTMIGSTANYGYVGANQAYLRQPIARAAILGRASYDLTDNINAYIEVNNARSMLFPYVAGLFSQGPGAGTLTPAIVVGRTNTFVTPALTTVLNSTLAANAPTFQIGRIHTEFGFNGVFGQDARQDYETRRFVTGLEGKFGDDWKWAAAFSTGRTRLEQKRDDFSPVALQKAVDGCAGVTAASPGFNATSFALVNRYEQLSGKACVPFNPFGVGRNSADALHYVTNDTYQIQHVALDGLDVSLSGAPFAVPAGNVAVAVGAEWRKESLSGISDAISAAGSGGTGQLVSNSLVTSPYGKTSVKEGFVEVGVPLLKDKAWARSLDFNAAGRITDYELSGTVRTWKLGASWQPLDVLRLRFTRSHDIRAPNIRSLFFHGGPNSANVINRVPNGTVGLNGTVNTGFNAALTISVPVPGNSGNPNLKPEIGDTTTGGVVFTSGGFNASVDYYQIYLNDAIAAPGNQQTLDQCTAGDKTYCNFITFDSTVAGGISLLEPLLLNLNRITIQGYDVEVGYRRSIGPGTFSVRALVNYEPHVQLLNSYLGQTTEAANVVGQIGGMQGAGGQPEVGYNLSFGYGVGRFDTTVQIRGFGRRRANPIVYNADGSVDSTTVLGPEDGAAYAARIATALAGGGAAAGTLAATANTVSQNRLPAQFTVNPSVTFRINGNISAFVNIDNLFDVGPPPLLTNSIYDLIGRRYRAGVRANF